jgi:hypothetical protein
MSQTFTLLNNGNAAYNINSFSFTTPSGLAHRVNLSNFGGSSNFTGNSYSCSVSMAPGQSRTFDLGYVYVSGASDTRVGSVIVNTDSAASTTLSTTIRINGGGVVTVSLPGQGSYSATRTDAVDPTSLIRLLLRSNGSMRVELVDGNDFDGNWVVGGPINGIGSNYWVKFTRNVETGQAGIYSSSQTTGWLHLDVNREILISATGSSNGTASSVETDYTVQIASDSSGSTIVASGTYLLDVLSSKAGSINKFGNITVESYFGDVFSEVSTAGGVAVTFTPDGQILQSASGPGYSNSTIKGYWFINGNISTGSSYWIRAIRTCGNDPGNLNTWYQLSSSRSWGLGADRGVPASGQIQVEISTSPNSSNIVATGYVNMLAADYEANVIACEFSGTVYNYAGTNQNTGINPIDSGSVVLDLLDLQ